MNYSVDKNKVIYADLDPTEGVLLQMDTKNYYRLNETGQIIWKGLMDGISPEKISEKLELDYAISKDQALADTQSILKELTRERLLSVAGEKKPAMSIEAAHASKKGKKGA